MCRELEVNGTIAPAFHTDDFILMVTVSKVTENSNRLTEKLPENVNKLPENIEMLTEKLPENTEKLPENIEKLPENHLEIIDRIIKRLILMAIN